MNVMINLFSFSKTGKKESGKPKLPAFGGVRGGFE
jgi:hypothetical protein